MYVVYWRYKIYYTNLIIHNGMASLRFKFTDVILHRTVEEGRFHKMRDMYWLALGFCDRASWANCEVREKTHKMQQLDVYYQYFLNMFRASLCPSSGEQDVCYCTWCAALVLLDVVGSGFGALRCWVQALWRVTFTMMPETCWEIIDNKRLTVASCWFFSLTSQFAHDARSQKPNDMWSVCL